MARALGLPRPTALACAKPAARADRTPSGIRETGTWPEPTLRPRQRRCRRDLDDETPRSADRGAILSTICSPSGQRTWPTPPAGIAMTTRATSADHLLDAHVARRLLRVQEAGERPDQPREEQPAEEADARGAQHAEPVVRADGAETAERGDEDAEDARAEEAGPAVREIVIGAEVEVLEQLAEEQGHEEKDESDRGEGEEDRELRELRQPVHAKLPGAGHTVGRTGGPRQRKTKNGKRKKRLGRSGGVDHLGGQGAGLRITPSFVLPFIFTTIGASNRRWRTHDASSTAGCRASQSQSTVPSPASGFTVK